MIKIISIACCVLLAALMAEAELVSVIGGATIKGATVEDQIRAYIPVFESAFPPTFSPKMKANMSKHMDYSLRDILANLRAEGEQPTLETLIEVYRNPVATK